MFIINTSSCRHIPKHVNPAKNQDKSTSVCENFISYMIIQSDLQHMCALVQASWSGAYGK